MKQKYEVVFTLGSWIYLSGLVGLTGGIVLGIISALWSALNGEWTEALVSLFLAPIFATLSLAFSSTA